MSEITNTSTGRAAGEQILAEAMVTGDSSAAIENQERAGQAEVVHSSLLPGVSSGGSQRDADFEALGFTFGEMVPGDDLFRQATLPEGWTREGSDHAMWSYLLDERGFRRVAIFYKAAFYDRRAHMRLLNVGTELASGFIYGDEPEPEIPEVLTAEEVEESRLMALRYLGDCERAPSIYSDRKGRAEQWLAALPEASEDADE